MKIYQGQGHIFIRLCVFWCQTSVVYDTDTCNYIKLFNFLKLLAVSVCRCSCHVQCLYPCFIDQNENEN